MINHFFELCQKVNFKLNLLEILIVFTFILLIKVIVLLIRKFVCTFRNDGRIDERMRERRQRIAQVAAEINDPANSENELIPKETNLTTTNETESLRQITANSQQVSPHNCEQQFEQVRQEELTSSPQKTGGENSKKKKTRAMPMEERWAEFDKKRAAQNSA